MSDLSAVSRLLATLPPRSGFGDASLIRHREGSIDLGGGNPDPETLPVDLYRDAVREVTDAPGFAESLKYVPAAGIPALRAWLAAREGVAESRILVTTGGAHGLALAALATLDAGDLVVVDDPVYPLFLRTLELVGAEAVPVRVGPHGIDVDALEERLRAGLRPKALFTVPTFQNPSGVTLPGDRARRLAELAETYGFALLLDDPYRELPFVAGSVDVRSRLTDSDRTIAVNTLSKTLGPALRLGWMVVPEHLSERFVRLRSRLDGQTSGPVQEIALRILQQPGYARSLELAGAHYARKADALGTALRERFDERIEFAAPDGGFFLWARLCDDAVDTARLHDIAQDEGVFFQRGEWFAAADPAHLRGYLRLSYSEPTIPQLQTAAGRLHRAAALARG